MIGVFDSGLGGLTVLKELKKELPERQFVYLGDNARAPYGNRSQETIYGYTKEAIDFLFAQGCNLIIIACNTASARALRKIQQEYLPKQYPKKNVLGVIRPLVEKATMDNSKKRIGVLGTKATIKSNVYRTELHKINKNLEVFQKSAPLLVPLIEENWVKKPETKMILKKYLRSLKIKNIEILILACTHYPFLLEQTRKIMNKRCEVYNPGEIVAKSLKEYLIRHPEYDVKNFKKTKTKFFVTDDLVPFKCFGEHFLNEKIEEIQKVSL